jgi:hypothetical protein
MSHLLVISNKKIKNKLKISYVYFNAYIKIIIILIQCFKYFVNVYKENFLVVYDFVVINNSNVGSFKFLMFCLNLNFLFVLLILFLLF